MSKEAYVEFKRSVVIAEAEGMTEEEIRERAVDIWNEEMELEDILMDEDHIINVEIEGEEKPEKILVRVDLFKENERVDAWEGYIYGLTQDEFNSVYASFEHDYCEDIFINWSNHLSERGVKHKQLHFAIDHY